MIECFTSSEVQQIYHCGSFIQKEKETFNEGNINKACHFEGFEVTNYNFENFTQILWSIGRKNFSIISRSDFNKENVQCAGFWSDWCGQRWIYHSWRIDQSYWKSWWLHVSWRSERTNQKGKKFSWILSRNLPSRRTPIKTARLTTQSLAPSGRV